jgi:hypothetical protein
MWILALKPDTEDQIITTSPGEVEKIKEARKKLRAAQAE